MRSYLWGIILGFTTGSLAFAQSQGEMESLRQDVEMLKQGQESLRKDIDELKKFLQARQQPPPVQPLEAVVELGDEPAKGKPDAALTLIEYSDFQCPFCRRYVQNTLPQLEREYVETGKLRYVFRDFPLEQIHPQALKAAEAAHCAGEQGKYWEMHDKLFAEQQALGADKLPEYAQALGLDVQAFRQCLASGRYAETIRKDIASGEQLGISGTPTFILGVSQGGQLKKAVVIRGAQPFKLFKEEIDKHLAGKS
jgi:protein-disulfide isomerase